jgi:SAM-dependent methyltransferase
MGIDLNGAQLLIMEHKNGVSFERMATLGRQGLHANRPALISVLREAGYEISMDRMHKLLDPTTEYSEELFGLLGAREVNAIDVSDYEGAQIVHDMNRRIPDRLASAFDLVLDSGTLEHIFDFPTALRNSAQMVRPNGRFISITMANNFCGHGFYQFSPELFYRFLCSKNGYVVESCIIWEDVPGSRFYQVPDPDAVRTRIDLTSDFGTYMIVKANRLGDISPEFTPQQSDYLQLWNRSSEVRPPPTALSKLASLLSRDRTIRSAFVAFNAKARYRRLRINRNAQRFLTPLNDMRVLR